MVTLYINVRKKQKGQSRMDNPETLEIMGTQDTGRIHTTPDEYTRHRTNRQNNTTQQTKNMSKTVPPKFGLTQMLARGKQFLIRKRHPPCYRSDYNSES